MKSTLLALALALTTLTTLLTAHPSSQNKTTTTTTTTTTPLHPRNPNPKPNPNPNPNPKPKPKTKPSCISVTLASGKTWDRLCNPAHTCLKITSRDEAPVRFRMPPSTVCTLYRGGAGDMDTLNAWCHGTPRDFEGGDADLDPLPVWWTGNARGWACYERG
ncbi:hypothetical protein FKW77_005835 [Venturia effusa]|uniref:Uncharacterized protein n=1 Tax=Venturia effusa TaxID=50376 RepID=A0A517L7H1_9PEZI|nr:hypothetical protein FKW77_005835 [Venturia effusa]